jgi:hypothetical protein
VDIQKLFNGGGIGYRRNNIANADLSMVSLLVATFDAVTHDMGHERHFAGHDLLDLIREYC